jgi:uncharacterized protein (TIGR04551 family)
MTRFLGLSSLTLAFLLALGSQVVAQPAEGKDDAPVADEKDDDKADEAGKDEAGDDKVDDGTDEGDVSPRKMHKPEPKVEEEPVEEVQEPDAATVPDSEFQAIPELAPEVLESITPDVAYPYIEHHGSFRFRTDSFYNLDLNTSGTSPILPPPSNFLPEGNPANSGAEWYAGANIRFRYAPALHIYEDLSIHLEMDLPDNLVMGSTPDGLNENGNRRSDVPLIAFSGGQAPPDGRFNLRLKQAFGQVKTFFGVIRAGRMASQWGLGILANGGGGMDDDYGDYADRVLFMTKVLGAYVVASYDFPSEGPLTYETRNPMGQARDADEFDDVSQYVLAVFRRPITQQDNDEQNRRLKEEGLPVFNGGFYLVYREQEASYEDHALGDVATAPDDYPELVARNASAWIPDLWVQFLWEPRYRSRLRIELEAVALYGEIGFVKSPSDPEVSDCFGGNADLEACTKHQRDIKQFGLAVETEFKLNQFFTFGLYGGYATGRNAFGFQLNEGKVEPEAAPSNFKFDRNYHVDTILFREIIGAVTNTIYVNPWAQFDFWTRNKDTFGFRFSPIYARAVEKEATPSGKSNLGIEFDSLLFYREEGRFQTDLGYALLIPLDAFDAVEGRPRLTYPGFDSPTFQSDETGDAGLAHSIQARMFWFF